VSALDERQLVEIRWCRRLSSYTIRIGLERERSIVSLTNTRRSVGPFVAGHACMIDATKRTDRWLRRSAFLQACWFQMRERDASARATTGGRSSGTQQGLWVGSRQAPEGNRPHPFPLPLEPPPATCVNCAPEIVLSVSRLTASFLCLRTFIRALQGKRLTYEG
jgi:hypothetical protein